MLVGGIQVRYADSRIVMVAAEVNLLTATQSRLGKGEGILT